VSLLRYAQNINHALLQMPPLVVIDVSQYLLEIWCPLSDSNG